MDFFANGISISCPGLPSTGERIALTPGNGMVPQNLIGQSDRLAGASKDYAMPHNLELLIENRGDLLCVEVEGQLAAATADRLTREVDSVIDMTTQPVRAVILNCKRMDYVSGLGWHSILLLARSLVGRGIRMLLVDLQRPLRDIFDNRNFLGLLSIHPTMAEALNSLSEPCRPESLQPRS